MRHIHATDEVRERAALYALGALGDAEARAFAAHLRDGCPACAREAEAFGAVATNLAYAAPAVPPRPELRARVLAAARADADATLDFVLADEGAWTEVEPGVFKKPLDGGPNGRPASYLVRLAPGVTVPAHEHAFTEHCYVVAGDLHVAGRHLREGDYHRAGRGSTHAGLRSERGCVLLIVEGHT